LPAMWEQQTFIDRAGPEILGQMYAFEDKRGRPACLIPEVTGIVAERWRDAWVKTKPKPFRVFYESRCYRYERPQKGRYREFTQMGVEILGGEPDAGLDEAKQLLVDLLDELGVDYGFNDSVRRGLSYYTSPGFEVECHALGAQRQVAGGGPYAEGVGWAIGVDRLLLALHPEPG
jgi:histidyl-tRNA synthetase